MFSDVFQMSADKVRSIIQQQQLKMVLSEKTSPCLISENFAKGLTFP
jgi:hypothetical protein